jgi:NADPH-dependent F420 reductase
VEELEEVLMTEHKPVIAILGGTGNEGPGLAMRWTNAGYKIIIGSRKEEKAIATAETLNAQLGNTSVVGMHNNDAAATADISVLTVVQSAHQSALQSLKEALKGKILVDATARVEFRDPKPPSPPSAAQIAQDILGFDVTVVAAFQNVPAHALKALDEPIDSDVLVCAEDIGPAQKVIRLAEDGGMRAYYAGGLGNAIVVEGLTAILINVNKFYKKKTASVRISGL